MRADDLAVAGTPGRRGPGRAGGRLVLALALAMSLAGAHGEPAAAAPAGGAANGNRVWRVPLGSLTATRERPIFSSSRRPPAAVDRPVARATPPPPPLVAPEPEPLRLSLMGTIGGQADGVAIEAIAIFVDQATRDIVRLKAGDRHAGWMLQSVKGRSAVLESGQRSETLTLPRPDQTVAQRALRPASEPPASDGVPGSILNIEPAPLPD